MKVILPMAGSGTRLRPLTWSKPKPLIPVAGKPVLGHVLDMFHRLPDLEEVICVVGLQGEQVREYVHRAYPKLRVRFVEQKELLGQSHTIWLAREFLRGPILVHFIDTLLETDFQHIVHKQKNAVSWVKRVEDPRAFGVVELGLDGFVRCIKEKPASQANKLVVVGSYYLPSGEGLIQAIEEQMKKKTPPGTEYFLADALNLMLNDGLRMKAEEVQIWEDCGKPEELLHANRYLLAHGRDNSAKCRREGVVILPPVFIAPDANVQRSVIGPNVSLAAGCRVENSILRDAIVDEEAKIERMVISESLVGCRARLSGKFSSLRVGDSSEMRFADGEEAR